MVVLMLIEWTTTISSDEQWISGRINSVTAEFETKINIFCIVKILEREFYLKMLS